MANQKISQLNPISGVNVDNAIDVLAIVDTSAAETKKISREELFKSVGAITVSASFTVGGTAFTVDGVSGNVGASGSLSVGGGLTTTGNVGIGTAAPTEALDVVGNVTISGDVLGAAVQSTELDLTVSKLLKVGSFGLGVAATLSATDNLDNIFTAGLYYNPTEANTPNNNYPLSSAGSLLVIGRTANNVTQRFSSYGGGASQPDGVRIFERSWGGVGWTPWVEVYHQGRVLGTVSQSGGVPTDALIERGSNANGEYVRFADGTQICWGTIAPDFTSTATQGFSYPATFSATPRGGILGIASGATDAITNYQTLQAHGPQGGGSLFFVKLNGAGVNGTGAAYQLGFLFNGRWF